MKKLILILFGFLMLTLNVNAQEKVYSVKESDLTENQLKMLKANEVKTEIENYAEWVGIGEEIGTLVRSSLMGVKDVAVEFSDTNVGAITIGLVIWNYMGIDVIRIIFGLIIYTVITILYIRYLKTKVFTQRYIQKYEVKPILWGLFNKKYAVDYYIDSSDDDDHSFISTVVYAILVLGIIAIMFA